MAFYEISSSTSATELNCFHRGISRAQAEELLLKNEKDGSFLVRESETIPDAYTLCILIKGRVVSYRILPYRDGALSIQFGDGALSPKYTDLIQLIQDYRKKGIENGMAWSLLYPVPADDLPGDHARLIREQHYQLLSNITCIADIVAQIFQQGKLTQMEFESLQQCQSAPIKLCEELLRILMRKPADFYECFLKSLKKTEQYHVYQMLRCPGQHGDIQFVSEHSRQIRHSFDRLSETIDPESGLLEYLLQTKVVSNREFLDIKSRKDVYKMNDAMLLLIIRKSSSQFEIFKEGLIKTNQEHVINIIENMNAGMGKKTTDKIRDSRCMTASNAIRRTITVFENKVKILENNLQIEISLKIARLLQRKMETSEDIAHILNTHCKNIFKVENALVVLLRESHDLKKQMKDNEETMSMMTAANDELTANIKQLQIELESVRLVNSELNEQLELNEVERSKLNTTILNQRREFHQQITALEEKLKKSENNSHPVFDTVKRSEIEGMAILNDEIYVSRCFSPVIEVYDTKTFKYSREWRVEGLVSAVILEFSKDGRCLFILNGHQYYEIIRVDVSGHLMKRWTTEHCVGTGDLDLSATFDSNVILTVTDRREVIEYSSDGNIMRRICLTKANLSYPRHCIKLSPDQYAVCFDSSLLHGCIYKFQVKADDLLIDEINVIKSFYGQVEAAHLAVDQQGSIYVSDKRNCRVLMFDSQLTGTGKIEITTEPRRFWLNESNDRLFVMGLDSVMTYRLSTGRRLYLLRWPQFKTLDSI